MMEPDVESINNDVKLTKLRGHNDPKLTARSMMNQAKPSIDKQVI